MPYTIQGQPVSLGAEPFLHNNKHYVPLRDVVEALGGNVSFDNNVKAAIATIGQWTARITMADRNVDVSGTPVQLSADPYVEDGQMYVPFDFFHDAFGYSVALGNDDGAPSLNISNPNVA
jgi:hypothetical protein